MRLLAAGKNTFKPARSLWGGVKIFIDCLLV